MSKKLLLLLFFNLQVGFLIPQGEGFGRDTAEELTRSQNLGARPNVVVFLADDLGYFDVGFNGNPVIQTPNLDRFAAQGVTFKAFYSAAPICSPARAGLLTGLFPNRVGIYDAVDFRSRMTLPNGVSTIADLLKSAGYATYHGGKWHLTPEFRPGKSAPSIRHGFDRSVPGIGMAWQLVAEAVDWIRKRPDPKQPFFCYLAPYEPHNPVEYFSPPAYRRIYQSPQSEEAARKIPYSGYLRPHAQWQSRTAYFGAITQLDDAFGYLIDFLEKSERLQNTFILFTSDNGPERTTPSSFGSPGPFSGCKVKLYEGGIRVPAAVQWPGRHPSGLISEEPIHFVDVLPTICELTGTRLPPGRSVDGVSMIPALQGQRLQRQTPLYWFYWAGQTRRPNRIVPGGIQGAMRVGDWKLLGRLEPLRPEWTVMEYIRMAEFDHFELYDLSQDPSESRDLSQNLPEEFQGLKERFLRLHREVRANPPAVNLEQHRSKAQHLPPKKHSSGWAPQL